MRRNSFSNDLEKKIYACYTFCVVKRFCIGELPLSRYERGDAHEKCGIALYFAFHYFAHAYGFQPWLDDAIKKAPPSR